MSKYSFEQKVEVVEDYFSGTLTQKELVQHLNLNCNRLVWPWLSQKNNKNDQAGYEQLYTVIKERYIN
ncbi:transposase [Leuconostoc inhae]|uniref:transposase n=1 Tax=Leuconostoc inhae TaxID=178001 RepID=UPI001C7D86AF|nr:transposase [Leuconostoc inhae]